MAGRKLYTEADVRALARGSELVLGRDALATPAALDAAFERGIRIVRGDGAKPAAACGCGNPACPGACAFSRMVAQDGTYVVVVRGGRPSISRLTDSGPVPFS